MHREPDDIAPQFAAANYLVVAMIIAFRMIAVSNALIVTTWHRRREFAPRDDVRDRTILIGTLTRRAP